MESCFVDWDHLSSSFSFCLAIPVKKYVLRPFLVLVLSRTPSIGLNWIGSIALSLAAPPLLHLAYSADAVLDSRKALSFIFMIALRPRKSGKRGASL